MTNTTGRDPVFGVRPLKRALQRYLRDELAMALLDEKIKEGQEMVINTNGEKILIV